MYVNCSGEFMSVGGVRWRVDLLMDASWGATVPLEFDIDPLTIEWAEESKEKPICGSTATLNIISPGDRTFSRLYTESAVGVQMKVFRQGRLYWSGHIDTEFYEEPYITNKGYTVTLTFSDFGVLDRLQYDMQGKKTIAQLVKSSLLRSGFSYEAVDTTLISGTALASGLVPKTPFLDLLVESSNFYDEDGEALTLREVLEGILQPLALRMVQRAGKIWLYDLNGLHGCEDSKQIDWQSTDQMLSTDKIYNSVKVTWSPYVAKEISNSKDFWTDDASYTDQQVKDALNSLNPIFLSETAALRAYHYSVEKHKWQDKSDVGFAFLTSSRGRGATLARQDMEQFLFHDGFYKILPGEDGTESEGVALRWPEVGEIGSSDSAVLMKAGFSFQIGGCDTGTSGAPIVVFDPVRLPPIGRYAIELGQLRLRLSVNMLMDPRYNPNKTAENDGVIPGEKSRVEYLDRYFNYFYLPVAVKFQPSGSSEVYVWTNSKVLRKPWLTEPITSEQEAIGHWVAYDGTSTYGYLAWYEDRVTKSAVMGWRKNRTAINANTRILTTAVETNTGQCIPIPPGAMNGGNLWVEVLRSPWIVRLICRDLTAPVVQEEENAASTVNWVLLESPDILIERNALLNEDLDDSDIEYKGVINLSAKEDLELDTICGTAKSDVLAARGAYFYPDGSQVTEIMRAGVISQAEDLLIGTLCSQFGTRHTKLTGTAVSSGEGMCTYTDAASEGITFMLAGAVEHPREDTVEGTFIEVSPDGYTQM